MERRIQEIRLRIDELNLRILELLNQRSALVEAIRKIKEELGIEKFDPQREQEMQRMLRERNRGPLPDHVVQRIFKTIFRSSFYFMEHQTKEARLIRRRGSERTVIEVRGVRIGGGQVQLMAGPCAVESREQLVAVAAHLSGLGVRILRGGAFKPRTSPYSFQGLGLEGLKILRDVARRFGMVSITEVMDPRQVELVSRYADILQIGTRNMSNFDLLKAVGESGKPVMLKRGFMATLEEYELAAEYIMLEGNQRIILCERGIRTFEKATRNTLDISAVPILKQETHLPVIVDISHSTGRKDIAIPMAAAALAAGADGIMVEVHDQPDIARSDSEQQLSPLEFTMFVEALVDKELFERIPPPAGAGVEDEEG